MPRPRLTKVFRDLKVDFVKTLLLVAAIAIGIFGVGSILGAYGVLTREMARNYLGTVPASATIEVEGGAIDQAVLDGVGRIPGVLRVERHATISSRMKIGGDWYPLLLFVVDDFNGMKTNRFTRISGAWPPPDGTVLVERTALRVMKSEEGHSITVKTPHGEPRSVPISGIVHDPGLAPAWQEQMGYAYASLSTLRTLGEDQGFSELRVLIDEGSSESIEEKSRAIARWVEERGLVVHEIQIPPPKRHPHQGQMNAVLTLFVVFAFMTLTLSAILVSTSLSTIMTKQVREIGLMKTIGASSLQVSGLYLFMLLVICALAVAIGVPPSRLSAGLLVRQIAGLLNLTIFDASIPLWVSVIQVAGGVLIPMIIASMPVLRGSRITVREALNNYGVSRKTFGETFFESFLSRFRVFGDAFTLSLRNVFRNRARLSMTLGLLAAGGALFMTALNMSKAWDANLQKVYKYLHYDVEIRLNEPFRSDVLISRVHRIPGVKEVEAWGESPASLTQTGGYDIFPVYPDKGHGSSVIRALPGRTSMVSFPLMAGRWLNPGHGLNEVVLNQTALAQAPHLKVGEQVSLSVDGHPREWRIVGFAEDAGSPAAAYYVPFDSYARFTETEGLSNTLRISLASRDRGKLQSKVREIETAVEGSGASVSATIPIGLVRTAIGEHMKVLVTSLLAMALLMAAVGVLGLMSAMSTNVFERTRELGIMRAIGATPRTINVLVVVEGLITGVLSLPFAFGLSLLLSWRMGHLIGNMSFRVPLPLSISPLAIFVWVGLILLGSILATLYPAWRANCMTPRDALSYG
ncbi:MAG: FtsX-like permease family protein [Syntrophorhabdales bacterium]|jgi:putative ABC transport system permease protein